MVDRFDIRIHKLADGRKLEYGFLPSKNYPNKHPHKNIVYFSTHAKKLNDKLTLSLARLTRDSINPRANLILLANINYGNYPYKLTNTDIQKIKKGDLSPISALDIDLLRSLGDLKSVLVIGASFGASRAAKALSLLEAGERVQGAVLLGAPNVVPRNERGPIMLRRYFSSQAKHIKPQAEASQIPQEVLDHEGLGDGIPQTLKLARKLAVYSFWGNILPANHALNQFFLQETFFRDITQASTANPDTPIIIGTSFDDPVSPYLKFCNFVLSDELPGSVTFKSYPGNHLTHSSPELIAKLAKQL